MVFLKRAIEFDCTGSDRLPADLTAPFRRKAFGIRRENGMPRAVTLSLLVHASIGAALFFQLVPQQFMRMPGGGGAPKTMEVYFISEPAGAGGGAQQPVQALVTKPAVVPAPVFRTEKKPEPIKKEPAENSQQRKTALPLAAAHMQAEEAAKGSTDDTAGSPQTGREAAGAEGSGGQTGAGGGNGNGGPFETNFGQADAPRFLNYVQPKYPLAARQQGREGTVVLRLTIDERGNLVRVEVVASPSDGFAESAVEAVKLSTFAPALRSGKAVVSRSVLPVRFALRH